LAGLGSVMLTNKLSARRADRDRERQERQNQRDHVVEVMQAGQDWIHNFTSMAMADAASGSMEKATEASQSIGQIPIRATIPH
jgi:hypothetical protein